MGVIGCLRFGCDDCDFEACPGKNISGRGEPGVIVKSNSLVSINEYSSNEVKKARDLTYFIGGVKIDLINTATGIRISKAVFDQSKEEPNLVINAGNLLGDHSKNKRRWFIPIDIEESYFQIEADPTCTAVGSCTSCSMTTGPSGCLRCACDIAGDCDMKPGIIIESDSVINPVR
jgi:hypothetical protein